MAKLTYSEIQYWLNEIKSCEKRQRKELIERWKYPLLVSYYEGDLQVDPGPYSNRGVGTQKMDAIINKHFPKTNVLIGEIMFQNPDFIAEPTKPIAVVETLRGVNEINLEEQAPLMKSAIKYAYDKIGLQEENRVALFDMLYAGYCAVEVDHVVEPKNKKTDMMLPGEDEIVGREKGMLGRAADKVKSKINSAKEAEERVEKEAPGEYDAYSTTNKTYGKRWDPMNILFDWKADRFKDSRYIIKKRIMSKSKFDAEFPKHKDKVTPGKMLDYAEHVNDSDSKSVCVYEIQIRKADNEFWTLKLTPTCTDTELDYYKRPYSSNGFNIKIGTLHKYGKIYPVPIAKINKTLADEMNEYVYAWKDVAERNVPKYLVDGNKVNASGRDALRSKWANDIVITEGSTNNAVEALKPTAFSNDNKELYSIYQAEQEKTWTVSDSKTGGKDNVKFATELQVQEAGFQLSTADIQEGLRSLIQQEMDTVKDLIVVFWDEEYYFKVTGGDKPGWYIPEVVSGIVVNPLTDMLTSDFHIKVDISKAFRPNTEKEKGDMIALLREMTSPQIQAVLQAQGRTISRGFIDKIVKKFGQDPEIAFDDLPEQPEVQTGTAQPAGEEAMVQQLLAEAPVGE